MSLPVLALILLGFLVVILGSGVWISVGLGLVGLLAMVLVTDIPIGQVLATTVWSSASSWTSWGSASCRSRIACCRPPRRPGTW